MPIPFTCPHCGHTTNVAEQHIGQSGPCVSCGKPVTVPGPAHYGPPPKDSGGMSGGVIAAIILGVVAMLLVCGGGMAALLLPAVNQAREAARRSQCQNNLRHIALAMNTYHDVHGTFPSAYIPGEDGQPMHSWRTLILPYVEEQAIYDRYDFSKSWDDPANQAVVRQADIALYRCPSSTATAGETSYFVVVGDETMFPGDQAVRSTDVRDGLSNTCIVIELPADAVHWAEPKDFTVDEILALLGQNGSLHPIGVNVAFADGSVQFIETNALYQMLEPMATRAGGENIALPNF